MLSLDYNAVRIKLLTSNNSHKKHIEVCQPRVKDLEIWSYHNDA